MPKMSRTFKIALAVIAVAVIAFVGYEYFESKKRAVPEVGSTWFGPAQ